MAFAGAHDIDASHGVFTDIAGDQYNIDITQSVNVTTITALPMAYDSYKAITNAIRDWQRSDIDAIKLGIRFDFAYSQASSILDQLSVIPDISGVSLTARQKNIELRQQCIQVVEDQMRRCLEQGKRLLGERAGTDMTTKDKVTWIQTGKRQFEEAIEELERWNVHAKQLCTIELNHLYQPHSHIGSILPPKNLPIVTLAEMTRAREQATANPSIADCIWIDPSLLALDEIGDSPSKSRDISSWKSLLSRWARNEPVISIKFLQRRFGALNRTEQVMIEFRPYPPNLPLAKPGEYALVKSQALELGWMLHSANASDATPPESTAVLPLVPFRGVSELRDIRPPCFLLIYRGDNLETLFSVIEASARAPGQIPSKASRLQLAITLANAIFRFHRTGYVHGALTTDNIFLRADRGLDRLDPLLAGFEISRLKDGHSYKLDVPNRDHMLYLHPNRLPGGIVKDSNYPPYDVCSLGVILLEIGLWIPLRALKGMSKLTDNKRREEIYKASSSSRLASSMGLEYQNLVKYCLTGYIPGACAPPSGGIAVEMRELSFGSPNAAEVITILERISAGI